MAKFKVGDKVLTATGKRGTIDEVYGDEKYAVLFDGSSMPDRIEGFKLKVANAACDPADAACNAKFHRGQIVRDKWDNRTHTIKEVYNLPADLKKFERNFEAGWLDDHPNFKNKTVYMDQSGLVFRDEDLEVANSVARNAVCNGNGWTMADAKQFAQELSVIADKGYNEDWLEEGLDVWKTYGRQFANLVGPAEAKKVEAAIKSGRAKDIPRIVGGMKPYQPKGNLNSLASLSPVARNAVRNAAASVACNWQRSEDLSKVTHAIELLLGLHNNYVRGEYRDVDAAEEGAFKSMKDAIASLRKIADVFRRNRS